MPSVTVKFKSNEAASDFAASLSIMGDKAAIEVNESTAVVSSDDPKAVRFVKHTADEMVESALWMTHANRMLSAIMECVSSNKSQAIKLMDGTNQTVTVRQAEALMSLHDRLNEENQGSLLILASESSDSYNHAVNFARTNEESD